MTECGTIGILLIQSRLARAYNTVVPSSGKYCRVCGSNALHKPNVLGAARKIENGGSLTIIARHWSTPVRNGWSYLRRIQARQHGCNWTANFQPQMYPAIDVPASERDAKICWWRRRLHACDMRKFMADMNSIEPWNSFSQNEGHQKQRRVFDFDER